MNSRSLIFWCVLFFFFLKYLVVCSVEEEKYKVKSKGEIGRSKEYTCVEEKKDEKKKLNVWMKEKEIKRKIKLRNATIIFP